MSRLLMVYPRAWRERYGEELEALIVESSGDRMTWRVRADVVRAGARERAHAAGLGGDGRGGVLLVLCAWALFVLGGIGVRKASEQLQTTPAFTALVVLAVCASLLVLAGIALSLPALAAYLRAGGWPAIRRRVVQAVVVSAIALAALTGLVAWAHGLSAPQRDGGDTAYALAFVGCGLLIAASLFAWTAVAVAIARRLDPPPRTLTLQAWLAVAVTVAMVAMTVATLLWWAAAAPVTLELLVAAALMVTASLLGGAGAQRALRA